MSELPLHLPTISLLISNMHCPSCCDAITNLLSPLSSIRNLSISLLLRTITFSIDTSISSSTTPVTPEKIVDDVTTILSGEGGFVVYQEPIGTETSSNTNEDTKMGWLHYGSGYRKQRKERRREEERRQRHLEHCETCREQEGETPDNRYVTEKSLSSNTGASSIRTIDVEVFTKTIVSIEGMTCASCTTSITSNLESHPSVSSAEINLLSSSGIIRHRLSLPASEVIELIEDAGFDASIISSDSETPPDSTQSSHSLEVWTSTFMIEGMTCASCSSAIDRALRDRPEIRDISIDVLGNKGVIVHNDSISHDTIKSIIEDLGYGAELISHEGQSKPKRQKGINADQQRTVSLRVQGVYCGDCITQINTHLRSLPLIRYTPVSLDHPISTVSYIPRKPLTIRTILDGLTDLAPEFDAEVVRPQSLSERSRQIQKKEVRMLAAHFGVALLFAIPTFIIAIVGMVLVPSDNSFRQGLMTPLWGSANKGTLALWPLASVVQFGVGRLFYRRALNSMWPHLRFLIPPPLRPDSLRARPSRALSWRSMFSFGSMDLLVVLSTSVSYFASIAMLVLDVRAIPGTKIVGTYFDSCVFLIMFILLGRTLEAFAKSKTTDAISLLGLLRPDTALFIDPLNERSDVAGTETMDSASSRSIPVDRLERGDLVIVQPGSLPPTDGIIVSGSTTLDESSLTGESRSVSKGVGDEIFTGTINKSSAIVIRVTNLASETMLEGIIAAVSDASAHKAPLEKLAEKLTGVFVPIIVYVAIIVLIVWISVASNGRPDGDAASPGGRVFFAFEFAIATLVVACPCGIGLAIPCANAVGNGISARAGILASGGGQAFLAATKVKTIVLDKTGTLTIGQSVVTDSEFPGDAASRPILMRAIREIESQSTHPLALGLVAHIDAKGMDRVEIIESNEVAGRGIWATVKVVEATIDLLVGNVPFMLENRVAMSESCETSISKWSTEAKSVVLVATRFEAFKDHELSVMFALSDPPRESTPAVLASLREKGYHLVMLSGDNVKTARAVGKMVGIDVEDVRAGVGPEEKAGVIRELQKPAELSEEKDSRVWWKGWKSNSDARKEDSKVMFVGDGLNDSVALAAADVAVAMGHGSQATLASADFVLLNSSLETLLPLLTISTKVYNRQRLNLLWAIIFNVICLPFAAGVFYPAHQVRLTPVWSAVLMALSSVSVVCSSLALRW